MNLSIKKIGLDIGRRPSESYQSPSSYNEFMASSRAAFLTRLVKDLMKRGFTKKEAIQLASH